MNVTEETTVNRLVHLLDRAQTREDEINHDLVAANAARDEAVKARADYKEYIDNLERQVKSLLEEAREREAVIRKLEGNPTISDMTSAYDTGRWSGIIPERFHKDYEQMVMFMSQNERIKAIKKFRLITGEGLLESKNWMEGRL